MSYCKKCGQEIPDNSPVCPICGAAQDSGMEAGAPDVVDNGGFGWGLLGFCVPVVGLILFLVWKDTKPKTAKAAGMGALISVIITAVFYVITLAAGMGAAAIGAGASSL